MTISSLMDGVNIEPINRLKLAGVQFIIEVFQTDTTRRVEVHMKIIQWVLCGRWAWLRLFRIVDPEPGVGPCVDMDPIQH